ncbi:MAG TPA: hypothetical protein VFR23_04275 [Jiangellaceae bacterium]|nr:hypothetical protein [Jiangellaceae bacterium]
MPLRPCLECGALSQGTRCPNHTRSREQPRHQRAKRAKRPYTWAEQQRRAQAVRAWIAEYGYVCPGWHTPPHPSMDLTADHIVAFAINHDERGDLGVLCRTCNGRKAANAE